MLQSDNLTGKQIQQIHSAHESINRLSRISQGLTLLNKIENEEFKSGKHINFSTVAEKSIKQFEELAQLKGIEIKKDISPNIMLPVDVNLAEILVGNLIKNAIHHNEENGWIGSPTQPRTPSVEKLRQRSQDQTFPAI